MRSLTVVAAEPVPWWREIAELHAPNPGGANAGDLFGWSLAMNDDDAVVGMNGSAGSLVPSRAAFVYRTDTRDLVQTLAPIAPSSPQGDSFGSSVAISGNLVAVGARFEDVKTSSGTTLFNAGAAHVYDLTTGQHLARLTADIPADISFFGESIAIDGTNVLVGGRGQAAYLFNAMTGQQLAKLNASVPMEWFGGALAVNATLAVISGRPAGSNELDSVYVFDLSTGMELRKIAPADGSRGDVFGSDIALDGNIAIVGSVFHTGPSLNSGAAYIYDVTTGQQLAKLLPPILPAGGSRPNFGEAVAIDGNIAVVSAPLMRGAFVFDWTSETPLARRVPKVLPTGSFGLDVATSQGLAIVALMVPCTCFESQNLRQF